MTTKTKKPKAKRVTKAAIVSAIALLSGIGVVTSIKKPDVTQTQSTTVNTISEDAVKAEARHQAELKAAEQKAADLAKKQDYYRLCLKNGYSTPGFIPNETKVKEECERAAGL